MDSPICWERRVQPYRPTRLPAALALVLAAAACGPGIEHPDQTRASAPPATGFACLADADEVANDPLNPVQPICRTGVLTAVSVDGRPVPGALVVERGPVCRHTQHGYTIDLAPQVAARLYERYQSEPSFTPLQDSPACPALDDTPEPAALPAGTTALLEITTVASVPATGPTGIAYLLPAAVAGRLVEAGTGRVLWQGTCRTDAPELLAAASFPDTANLERILAGEAEGCAAAFGTPLGAPTSL
jgi:hypothetical protein